MSQAISGSGPFIGTGEAPVHLLDGYNAIVIAGAILNTTFNLGPGELADSLQVTNGTSLDYIRVTVLYALGPTVNGNSEYLVHPGQAKAFSFSQDNPINGITLETVTPGNGAVDTFLTVNATSGGNVSVEFFEQ